MADLSVNMEANEKKVVRAFQAVTKMAERYGVSLKGVAKKSNEASKEEAKLAREAKRVFDDTRAPLENYLSKKRQLNTLLKRGKINQDTFNRAVRQAKTEYREAGQAGESAFGSAALLQVSAFAGGFLSLTRVIGGVTTALSDMAAKREEMAQKQREASMGLGSLAQLAKTPEDLAALKRTAKDFFAGGGAATLDEAARTLFAVKSAGQEDQLDLIRRLRRSRLVETPDVMARAATTLMTSMGREETGDLRAIVSKAFGASEYSPATAESLLEAASRAGTGGKSVGLSDEEILAATAITATATGTAELGGTQVAALVKALEKIASPKSKKWGAADPTFDLAGKNLIQQLEEIQRVSQEQDMSAGDLMELFGRQEGLKAYRVLLQNKKTYAAALQGTRRAQETDEVAQRLKLGESDPELRAVILEEERRARAELSGKRLGVGRNLAAAVAAGTEASSRAEGKSEWNIWADKKMGDLRSWFMGDEAVLQQRAGVEKARQRVEDYGVRMGVIPESEVMPRRDPELMGAVREFVEEQKKTNQHLDNIERKTRQQPTLAPVGAR